MRRLAVIALLAAAAGSALGSSSSASSARPSGAWKTFHGAAYSVSLPQTWVDFTRMTPTVLAVLKRSPSLRSFAEIAQRTHAVKLVAVDLAPQALAASSAANMNLVQASSGGADVRLAADTSVAVLRGAGALVGEPRRAGVRLPAGSALRLSYTARYEGRVVSQTQYYLLHAGTISVLTYTAPPSSRASYAPVFARSARSLRLR